MSTTKLLPSVTGTCRWCLPAQQIRRRLALGLSLPLMARRDGEGHSWEPYVLEATEKGWKLTHLLEEGREKAYHLPHDLSGCNCPDHRLNASRREDGCGCKHRRFLRALLSEIDMDPTF